MKTKSLVKLLLLGCTLSLLTSCQEEEFYEKEFVETYKEKTFLNDPDDPEVICTDPNATLDYSASCVDPINPGDDDGSTTGDDGSTTGDDGSTTGDDGSTTGDDGSTTGDDGSTTGDDGSDDPVLENVTEFFNQGESSQKMDILWVMDNSGSMREEQQAIAFNFDVFIQSFIQKGIDFKMAVTTTDTRGNNSGQPYQDSLEVLTSDKLAQDRDQFLADFSRLIQVGINGWGKEKGLKAAETFTNRYSPHYFRQDAYYIVVYITDEEDQSEKTPAGHLAQMQKWKNNAGLVKNYAIVNISDQYPASSWHTPGYARYEEIANLSGGSIADINQDFYDTLLNMGEEISSLVDKVPLANVPHDVNDIVVKVDGVEYSSGWNYDSSSNAIVFEQAPPAGSVISISYQLEQ